MTTAFTTEDGRTVLMKDVENRIIVIFARDQYNAISTVALQKCLVSEYDLSIKTGDTQKALKSLRDQGIAQRFRHRDNNRHFWRLNTYHLAKERPDPVVRETNDDDS